ncbi:MAG: BamA/TamA family outer membrane protein [Ignavibacteriales bacterium]|nr:BamA/TamA family outer membrane protein [Ignavibacteriales bacterium]
MSPLRDKFTFFIVFFLALSFRLQPQILSSISIQGNSAFSDETYLRWIDLPPRSSLFPGYRDTVQNRISEYLSANGYFFSEIDSIAPLFSDDSSRASLQLFLKEGPLAIIRSLKFTGADTSSSPELIQLYQEVYSLLEEPFVPVQFEQLISLYIDELEKQGYPFAKITVKSIFIDPDSSSANYSADITLLLDYGLLGRFNKIEIVGNSSTKAYVITREIKITEGENYSYSKISDIPRLLNRLRFFEPVPEPEFYFNSRNEGILRISVKERNTNNFDGIIGYVPSGKEGDGYVTGLVNISLRNLFGTGRAASVRWQKLDMFSQELELKYLEPYIFSYPFNIGGGFFQKKQDTTYVQRKFDAYIEFLATNEITFALTFGSESVIPTISDVPRFIVFNSSLVLTGLNFRIDTRNDPFSPTSGLLFINSYLYSLKKINGPEEFIPQNFERSINLQRLSVDFSYFWEIFNRQVIAVGLFGRELRGSHLEISDLYRLGGTNSLRGYRENQFLGSRVLWGNLEYRFLLSRRTYLFSFFDTGYYLRKADSLLKVEESSAYKSGYGLGINLETGLGVLSVSFAMAKGDSFSEGKIHFGIVNEF